MNAVDDGSMDKADKAAFAETQLRITDIIGRALQLLGRHPTGKQTMYNGRTGKALNGQFFMVPCYIMCSSQHQVHKKVRGVSSGPVDPQTKQPVAGRERDGGLRIGEMERDAMTAHGAEGCVHALLYNASDPAKITICHNCSMPTILADNGKHNFCKICNAFDTGLQCPISYTTELTRKELGAVGLNLQVHVAPIWAL
jgi:DNA-directed RNA polymerase II subunit RPB2